MQRGRVTHPGKAGRRTPPPRMLEPRHSAPLCYAGRPLLIHALLWGMSSARSTQPSLPTDRACSSHKIPVHHGLPGNAGEGSLLHPQHTTVVANINPAIIYVIWAKRGSRNRFRLLMCAAAAGNASALQILLDKGNAHTSCDHTCCSRDLSLTEAFPIGP